MTFLLNGPVTTPYSAGRRVTAPRPAATTGVTTATPPGPVSEWPRPGPGSVGVSAVVLAYNEALNIERALASAAWCAEVVVVDSGSTDGTQEIARAAGATVLEEPWRGYSGQREWVLRHADLRHDWVYFLDADEWISESLAAEVAGRLGREQCRAYRQRRRLVFLGSWIAHCGWYDNSWQTRLIDRRYATFDSLEDRVSVDGRVLTLTGDLVDENEKGLVSWLAKHVEYADIELARRNCFRSPGRAVVNLLRSRSERQRRPIARTVAKEVMFPVVPGKPLAKFVYMYLLRAGWRDGRAGFAFCFYHAWFEFTLGLLAGNNARAGDRAGASALVDLSPYRAPGSLTR